MANNTVKTTAGSLLLVALVLGAWIYLGADERKSGGMTLAEAVNLAREGKQNEAVEAIKKIIAGMPEQESLEAHLSLGLVYFKGNQHENALSEFSKSVEINKDTPMAYYFMGLIYESKALESGLSAGASGDLKRKALAQWESYLEASEKSEISRSHRHLGISREESIQRAQKHIHILKEELEYENK